LPTPRRPSTTAAPSAWSAPMVHTVPLSRSTTEKFSPMPNMG